MRDFSYHLPQDLNTAVATIKGGTDAKALAGGMTLIPVLKQRLASHSDLVDLSAIAELKGISVDSLIPHQGRADDSAIARCEKRC